MPPLPFHDIHLEEVPLDSPDDDADADWEVVDPRYDAPNTPSSTGDEAPRHESTDADSDEEEEENARSQGELVPRSKPGGYDSRVEQMLYENPELPILITEAGKSTESGRYIVYTIKTGVRPSFWLLLVSRRLLTDCD
jgi:hypothetical protein